MVMNKHISTNKYKRQSTFTSVIYMLIEIQELLSFQRLWDEKEYMCIHLFEVQLIFELGESITIKYDKNQSWFEIRQRPYKQHSELKVT